MVTHRSDRRVRCCAGFQQLGGAIVVLAAFSSPTGCGGSTNASTPEAWVTGAPAPDSGASSNSSPDSSAGSGSSAASNASTDCAPAAWGNPGKVENPVVAKVAVDAGTQGHEFGRSAPASLAAYNYLEYEMFFSGTSPAYGTRMVVHRPADTSKYNGTVIVEWYNVSGQLDFVS